MNELEQEATELPRSLRAGLAYTALRSAVISLESQHVGGVSTVHLGAEYAAGQNLQLRFGYQSTDTRKIAAGLGLVFGPYRIDYAYLPFTSDLGNAHRVTILLSRSLQAG